MHIYVVFEYHGPRVSEHRRTRVWACTAVLARVWSPRMFIHELHRYANVLGVVQSKRNYAPMGESSLNLVASNTR